MFGAFCQIGCAAVIRAFHIVHIGNIQNKKVDLAFSLFIFHIHSISFNNLNTNKVQFKISGLKSYYQHINSHNIKTNLN